MATLGNKKSFGGLVGNVVFRYRDGKQIVQSRPTNVKQTVATKNSASEFGKCSSWAKQLRKNLAPLLVGLTDGYMYQRFTAAVYNTIKLNTALSKGERTPLNTNMKPLEGFEFNTHSPFAHYFRSTLLAELTANKEVLISIPNFNPKTEMLFPDGCSTAKLMLYAVATDFKDTTTPLVFHNVLDINKSTLIPTQMVLTTTALPDGYFVVVSAKLLYYNSNLLTESTYLNTNELSPAKIVFAETIV